MHYGGPLTNRMHSEMLVVHRHFCEKSINSFDLGLFLDSITRLHTYIYVGLVV